MPPIGLGNTEKPNIISPPQSQFKDDSKKVAAYINSSAGALILRTFPWDTKLKIRDNHVKFIREPMTGLASFRTWYSATKLDKDTSLSKWIKVLEHLRCNVDSYTDSFSTWEDFSKVEKAITDAYRSK